MANAPAFDLAAVHKHFSASCFNKVWGYLDKPTRTEEENRQMILTAFASLWHWTQREEATDTNFSIGWWQLARVHAVAGLPDEARRYGRFCLEISQGKGVEPIYLGYAHEALARAESIAGNQNAMKKHLEAAHAAALKVTDEETRKMLLTDLETIR